MNKSRNSMQRRLLEAYIAEAIRSTPRRQLLVAKDPMALVAENFDRQMNQLLAEGLMDSLSSAYETVKGGVTKLKDKISDAAMTAMKKVNEMSLQLVLKGISVVKSSAEKVMSVVNMINDKIADFREEHPILYKIIKIVIIALIAFAIMKLFEGTAHAQATAGGKPIDPNKYMQMRGAMLDAAKDAGSDVDTQIRLGDAIKALDGAMKAKGNVDIASIKGDTGNLIGGSFKMITNMINAASKGNEDAGELLRQFKDLGLKTVVGGPG